MVSSVGPYRFSTTLLGAAEDQDSAISAGSGSPQNKLQRSVGNSPAFKAPRRFIKTPTEGTENQTVNFTSCMNFAGLIRVLSEGQQTQAPRSQATNMSNAERSNVMSKVCEKRSCSLMQ